MGLSLQACKDKYQFLNQQPQLTDKNSQKDVLLSGSGASNYVLVQNAIQESHCRMYHQSCLQPTKEAELYEWRSLTNKPIVKVVYIELMPFKHPQYVSGFVYTEHLIRNLETLADLPIEEALYIIKATLSGYESIFRILGSASIDFGSCGINQKGQCKIWINSNLSKNHPQNRSSVYKTEEDIVYQILRLVRGMTLQSHECFFISLQKHIDIHDRVCFKEVQNFISKYAVTNNITIAKHIRCPPIGTSIKQIHTVFDSQGLKGKDNIRLIKPKIIQRLSPTSKSDQFNILFPRELRRKKEELTLQAQTEHNLKTQRKITGKRNSLFVDPTFVNLQVPKFLSKKSISSPKNSSFQGKDKQNSNNSDNSLHSKSASFKKFPNEDDNIPCLKIQNGERRGSAQLSLNSTILAEITQRNEQNSQEKDGGLERSIRQCNSQNLKRMNRSQFCHQFSINIINQVADYRSQEGRRMKNSIISTAKTNINSNKSSPHKRMQSFGWNLRKKPQNFNSQFVNKNDNYFPVQVQKRRKSGGKYQNLNQIMVDLKESKLQFLGATDPIKQSFSFRNQSEMSMNNSTGSTFRSRKRLQQEYEERQVKEQMRAKEQEILKSNSWKKTIQNLMDVEGSIQMNKSISYGDDTYNVPFKLDKLGKIGRQLAQSIIPIPELQ